MKRYIRSSITSDVNDIVNNRKDVRSHLNEDGPFRNEEDLNWFLNKVNPPNPEITKYEPDDPDYETYHRGLNPNYRDSYYIVRWYTYFNYNATKAEELDAMLKQISTFEELDEFYSAICNIGDGTWFYTKRGNNPLNSSFEPVPYDPDYVTYVVDRHDAVLKSKISNLYRVLTIR